MSGIMKFAPVSFAITLAFAGQAFAQDSRPSIQIEPPEPIETPDIAPESIPEPIIESEDDLECPVCYSVWASAQVCRPVSIEVSSASAGTPN